MKKLLLGVMSAGLVCTLVQAQEESVVEAVKGSKAKTSLNVGVTVTDGNSDTSQINASLITEGECADLGTYRAGIAGAYGESKVDGVDETTMEEVEAFIELKKTLTERTYASFNFSYLYDDIADVDYRVIVSPGIGMYLLKEEDCSLSADFGPAYMWEKVSKETDDDFLLRFAERFEYTFSDTAKMWQSIEYLPRADNFGDYLLNFEAGVEALITNRASLRLVLQDNYDSRPGVDMKKNDLSLIAGLGFQL